MEKTEGGGSGERSPGVPPGPAWVVPKVKYLLGIGPFFVLEV